MRAEISSKKSKTTVAEKAITYIWLTGHIRNVGDSALRRPYVHAIKSATDIKVWGGAEPKSNGYLAGLDLKDEDLSPSFFRWYWDLFKDLRSREVNFAFNAGEFKVTKAYFFGIVALMPLLLAIKSRGGVILWAGAAIAEKKRGFNWPFKILARLSDLTRWRDCESSSLFFKADTMPDWAFALGETKTSLSETSAKPQHREYLAISLRGDRPYPSEEWILAIGDLSKRLNLKIIVVVQVKDDQCYALRIAERFNAPLVGWQHESHFDQEIVVREIYKKTKLIFSDRLHCLIMASTEGAVPLGWCESSTSKISRHFDLLEAPWVYAHGEKAIGLIEGLTLQQIEEWGEESEAMVRQAQEELQLVVQEISILLRQEH